MEQHEATRRVICRIENAATQIDGFTFATIDVGNGETLVVSERMPAAKAERLLNIPGFVPFQGEVDDADVEHALTVARVQHAQVLATASTPNVASEAMVEELRNANHAMAADNRSLELELENVRAQLAKSDTGTLQAELAATRGLLQAASTELANKTDELGTVRDAGDQAAHERDGLRQLLDASKAETATAKADAEALRGQLEQLKNTPKGGLQAQIDKLQAELAAVTAERDALKAAATPAT